MSNSSLLSLHRAVHAVGALATTFVCVSAGATQAAPDIHRPAAVIPVDAELPAKLHVYPPLAEALARGVVILQFRTENFRVLPVFGKNAIDVSPRLGHLHVTIDGKPGTWAHTSGDPIIVVGLPPGPHEALIELADPGHGILAAEKIRFVVPERRALAASTHTQGDRTRP